LKPPDPAINRCCASLAADPRQVRGADLAGPQSLAAGRTVAPPGDLWLPTACRRRTVVTAPDDERERSQRALILLPIALDDDDDLRAHHDLLTAVHYG
jgi:hypothetical protein